MWDEVTVQLLYKDNGKGGVAPSRYEIARQAYREKVRARQEAEQRKATIGPVTKAMSRLRELARAKLAAIQPRETPAARPGAEFPAE